MNNDLIYSDKLVDVDDKGIRLKKYYFPLGKAKFVKFQEIYKMEKKHPTLTNGKWRIWGSGNLMTWYPLDWGRPKRDFIFIIQMATQSTRIGFTVQDSKAFIEAVESKGIRIEDL